MRCPVCHQDKYIESRGIKGRDYSINWALIQYISGFCSNCHFSHKGDDKDSFEGQVKEYKKVYFMRRMASRNKEVIL